MATGTLTGLERALLDFEGRQWLRAGVKEDELRDLFGLTPVGYYQQLNALIQREEAIAYRPALCARLTRAVRSRRG